MAVKTFKDIRLMLADVYMSNIDSDDMVITGEEKDQVIRSLDSTHIELVGKNTYDFLVKRMSYTTSPRQKEYKKPDGQLQKIYIGSTEISYNDEGFLKDEVEGVPSEFWFTDNQKKIVLYPTPDDTYKVNIKYLDYKYALTPDGVPTNDFDDNNTINMPERLQDIYIEWLLYQTLGDYMRNQSKPRWQPTLAIAENKRKVFMQLCRNYDGNLRFIM